MNDASQEVSQMSRIPDVGERVMFQGIQLVVKMRHGFAVQGPSSCSQCFGNTDYAVCTELPSCGQAGEDNARLFAPDLEHEQTANFIALMRLKGEM